MNKLFDLDWQTILVPSMPLLEILLRGTIVYLALFMFMRVLRRESGGLGVADVLVVVLIADAAQNAMGKDYQSITEGLILVATIVFWDYTIDWLSYRFPRFRRLVCPPALLLVEDGRLIRQNMRREMVTEDELLSHLRQQGLEEISKVRKAYLEGDGHISVIADQSAESDHRPETKSLVG